MNEVRLTGQAKNISFKTFVGNKQMASFILDCPKKAQSGKVYKNSVPCQMWQTQADNFCKTIKDGELVLVKGYIDFVENKLVVVGDDFESFEKKESAESAPQIPTMTRQEIADTVDMQKLIARRTYWQEPSDARALVDMFINAIEKVIKESDNKTLHFQNLTYSKADFTLGKMFVVGADGSVKLREIHNIDRYLESAAYSLLTE
ncbi:MAG: single-stranded DNA-binding protein [Clostridia bacterium]